MRDFSEPSRTAFDAFHEIFEPGDGAEHFSVIYALCSRIEDVHFSYVSLSPWATKPRDAEVRTMYPEAWQARYHAMDYHRIDPVVTEGIWRCKPFEWSELDTGAKPVRRFFGEAAEFGLGARGFSVTACGSNNIRGLFSVSSDATARDWAAVLRDHGQQLVCFALAYHEAQCLRKTAEVQRLSKREREVVFWSAHGKTAWEVGQILHLSEGTVGFYLRRVCAKLGAANKSHAVALAIAQRLVDPFTPGAETHTAPVHTTAPSR